MAKKKEKESKRKKARPRDSPSKAFRNIMIGVFFLVLTLTAIYVALNLPTWIQSLSLDFNQTLPFP